MFVVVVLARFDIASEFTATGNNDGLKTDRRGEGGQAFPRMNQAKPSLGTMKPVAGDDVLLRVTPR